MLSTNIRFLKLMSLYFNFSSSPPFLAGRMDYRVNISHRLAAESLGLVFCLMPVKAAICEKPVV